MWASFLRREDNLVEAQRDRILRFGRLAEFAIDRGIDDNAWKRPVEATAGNEHDLLDLLGETV